MAALSRARSLSHSGGIRLNQYAFRQLNSQPVAALVSARRSYWSYRGPKSKGHPSVDAYNYMPSYPNRVTHRNSKHAYGWQYAYIESLVRGRTQDSRSASHWTAEEQEQKNGKSKESSRSTETPWETRTRMAGERYLRLMEEHMALLRKDPYWGLFGASELRGVWNPWRNSEPLRQRVDEKTWKAWEESKKAADHLRRTVKGEFWDETPGTRPPQSLNRADRDLQNEPVKQTVDEYIYDPISNKRIRRPNPNPPVVDVPANERPTSSASNDASAAIIIPVTKYRQPAAVAPESKSTEISSETLHKMVDSAPAGPKPIRLSGFASQPWLAQEGFIASGSTDAAFSGHSERSAWEDQRQTEQQRRVRANQQRQQARKELIEVLQANRTRAQPANVFSSSSSRAAQGNAQNSSPIRLKTSLYWDMQNASKLRYDETLDQRENLDLLRPDTIRAGVAKTVAATNVQRNLTSKPKSTLDAIATRMFRDREERLKREFSANKWNLKRNWNAYPGDIPRTPEERHARRQLLERSFAVSVDMMELEVAKFLDPSKSVISEPPAQALSPVNTFGELEPNSLLEAQLRYNKAKRQTAADVALANEVEIQKAAMTAYEDAPRADKAVVQGTESGDTSAKTPVQSRSTPMKSEEQKMQERALVREIRDIYETTYGTIDTKHRQRAPIEIPVEAKDAAAKARWTFFQELARKRNRHVPFKATPRPETSLQRALKEQKINETSNAVSGDTSAIVHDVSSKQSNHESSSYPAGAGRELDSSAQLLEASIRDFERIMSPEKQPANNGEKEVVAAGDNYRDPVEYEYVKPLSQQASDNLTAELAEIAAQAPEIAPKRSATYQRLQASTPRSFVLLTFDKRERKVRVKRTTSIAHEQSSPAKTIEAILSRLQSPAAYFSHMEALEKAGYELVAGSRAMLVYRGSVDAAFPQNFVENPATVAKAERGWGSPVPDETNANAPKADVSRSSPSSRPVRRVEESFSGIPPRLESERINEEVDEIEKRRGGPVWKVLKATLIVGVLFYSFGVTLEWLKDREKNKLIQQYRQEVKRVQELERKKAQEQVKSSGWGF